MRRKGERCSGEKAEDEEQKRNRRRVRKEERRQRMKDRENKDENVRRRGGGKPGNKKPQKRFLRGVRISQKLHEGFFFFYVRFTFNTCYLVYIYPATLQTLIWELLNFTRFTLIIKSGDTCYLI